MILHFYLRFASNYGQTIFISGNHVALGNDDFTAAIPIHYLNEDFWHASIEIPAQENTADLHYRYILRASSGEEFIDGCENRFVTITNSKEAEIVIYDTWNHAGNVGNLFLTQPFQQVLLPNKHSKLKSKSPKLYTHELRVKAPLLQADEHLCMAGSVPSLGDWDTIEPFLLTHQGQWWSIRLKLDKETFPIAYKYGIYNTSNQKFVKFEEGNNRLLMGHGEQSDLTILHDGLANFGNPSWKGAGVAIPVFSLKTKNSFGTGEFTDLTLLTDWAKQIGLKLIQLLPLNDTTATHTNKDSYPYAAISAFALHPLFINLEKVAGDACAEIIKPLKRKQKQLNELVLMDYEQVMKFKFRALKELYEAQKQSFLADPVYLSFFESNKHWLVPYAAFCFLRDKYQTSEFNTWKSNSQYEETAIHRLVSPSQKHFDEVAVHYFTQYHLHLQLKEASAYAHKNGIILKGDIPIGIYRHSVDAWMEPFLYNINEQAGAPPDDFAIKGQNWGFPTYNWKAMQENNFTWWRQRFEQIGNYFDAFRIDHILGFFRIWSIPLHAVEGVLGRFVPAIPIHINEFFEKHISFQLYRYCRPYITDQIIEQQFRENTAQARAQFFNGLELKEEFDTQQKVEAYFKLNPALPDSIKYALFDIISNVILIEDDRKDGQHFHFRISMEHTSSFAQLDKHSQDQLKELYIDYFFKRQDDFWKKEALHKLPGLKQSTNMLICGEDLGMVPHCVPEVMNGLGILSLEIQRMPKDANTEFFHPKDAPYMSVVTPSTHDMSTIRGWWEEDKEKTQRFFNTILGHFGDAPQYAEPWINKEIIVQHLYSPAMWSIFQLQDLMGIQGGIRRENPADERINIPADPNHYWSYRMHLTIEYLMKTTEFTDELKQLIHASGR